MFRNLILFLFFACAVGNANAQDRKINIVVPFAESTIPSVPEYSDTSNWCSLPSKADLSDCLPKKSDLQDNQANAEVDGFYIHPTTLTHGPEWNGDLGNKELNDKTDMLPIKYQSTVFNGSCKIYAPRYRQAHVRSFFNVDNGGREALMIAYSDVKRAFEYYLEHYNNGRPFIIASHSQGTLHASLMIREMV